MHPFRCGDTSVLIMATKKYLLIFLNMCKGNQKPQRLHRKLGTYAAVAYEIGRCASAVVQYVYFPCDIRSAVENLSQKER